MTSPNPLPAGNVTLLFTDMENSTPANSAAGDAIYLEELREPHFKALRDCIGEHGGVESGTPAGDSVLAVFQTPDAGLACARAMQERLQNPPLTATRNGVTWTVKVRIGVHRAEKDMQPDENGHYHSEDINLAARVMAQGKGGQILVSSSCYDSAGSRQKYDFHPWPGRLLKGYTKPIGLHEMLWQPGQKPQEPGRRWIPEWMRKYANAYIERPAPMQEVFDWLDGETPMLIVHGPGGMGKTRLCVQAVLRIVGRFEERVGTRFEGRMYGVALDKEFGANPEAVTPELLATALARSVKAPEEVQQNTLKALPSYLEGLGEILLFLDNAESVFNDDTLQWFGEIVPMLWNARWILSSRHDPDLPELALPYALERLETPQTEADLPDNPCCALFQARIAERKPAQDISDTASLVRVLQQTGGFPLAVELVAAQRKFATLREMATGLNSSLLAWQAMRKSAGQRRGEDDRHESMEACIHWSVQMLPPQEQDAYARLCVWAFDFDAVAAQSIADVPQAYLDHWQTMSLLERLELNGVTRYRLLPVFREYAAWRVEALQLDVEMVRQRYVNYYVPLAEANWNINDPARKAVLDREWRNMTIAAEYTDDADTLLTLSYGLTWYFQLSSLGAEGTHLQEQARRAAQAASNVRGEANCIRSLGDIALRHSDYETAQKQYEQALLLFRQAGDVLGEAYCIMGLGDVARERSEHEQARKQYEQALPLFWQKKNVQGEAYCIMGFGNIALRHFDYETAQKQYEQALLLFRQAGDVLGEAYCIRSLGDITLERSEHEQARRQYEQALGLYEQIPEPYSIGWTHVYLARVVSDVAERKAHVREARAAWMGIDRPDLVAKYLDTQFPE